MKKNTKNYIAAVVIIVILAIVVISSLHKQAAVVPVTTQTDTIATGTVSTTPSLQLPGLQTGNSPWIAEITNLRARLDALGLPALAQEGTVLHIHQHLDITIHGQVAAVPAMIGINEKEGFISPIHVHDTTGVIHVESPTVQTFTLGQFFDIWGVKFTSECIGGYCADASNSLRIYVNGQLYQGDPRGIQLAAHQEIYVAYGTTAELPPIIPSKYVFPAGE